MRKPIRLVMLMLFMMGAGCSARQGVMVGLPDPEAKGLGIAQERDDLHVTARAPEGWTAEPIKTTTLSIHQIWVSPTGRTAFGVIYSKLPFPVGDDLALWGFMREMKKDQGEAELLEKGKDRNGLKFVAKGRIFTIEAVLYTNGWDCWVTYGGRYSDKEMDEGEMVLARKAREQVVMGRP